MELQPDRFLSPWPSRDFRERKYFIKNPKTFLTLLWHLSIWHKNPGGHSIRDQPAYASQVLKHKSSMQKIFDKVEKHTKSLLSFRYVNTLWYNLITWTNTQKLNICLQQMHGTTMHWLILRKPNHSVSLHSKQ